MPFRISATSKAGRPSTSFMTALRLPSHPPLNFTSRRHPFSSLNLTSVEQVPCILNLCSISCFLSVRPRCESVDGMSQPVELFLVLCHDAARSPDFRVKIPRNVIQQPACSGKRGKRIVEKIRIVRLEVKFPLLRQHRPIQVQKRTKGEPAFFISDFCPRIREIQ